MGIDINQHRARIGSFNNFISRPLLNSSSYKFNLIEKQKTDFSTYKFSCLKAVIMIPIIISLCAAINQNDLYLYKSTSTLSSHHDKHLHQTLWIIFYFLILWILWQLPPSAWLQTFSQDIYMEIRKIKELKFVTGILSLEFLRQTFFKIMTRP